MCVKVFHSILHLLHQPIILSVIGCLSDLHIEVTFSEVIIQLLPFISGEGEQEKHSKLCRLLNVFLCLHFGIHTSQTMCVVLKMTGSVVSLKTVVMFLIGQDRIT